jgi:ABC-2 type transport system permease protein
MFLLFMGTFTISQGLLTTVIEEKSSRVVEVLLSAVSPLQLLSGKILGMAGVGFFLLIVWGGVGFVAAQKYNVGELVNAYRLWMSFLYFVPGFLLMAALLAAIGSACNELKEAQSMVFPLSLITLIPMIFWFYIAEHPESIVSVVLSYVPPITPFVMILRICADPHTPVWQIVSTLVVLWVSVAATMWAAGKVFRVGVLMYGKPPSLRELVRWVQYA